MMPLFDIVTHRDVTVNAQHSCDFNFRKLKADKISRGKHNVMRMAAIFANNSDEYQSMTRQCHMVSTYYVVVANLNFDHLNQLSTYCIGRKKRLAPASSDIARLRGEGCGTNLYSIPEAFGGIKDWRGWRWRSSFNGGSTTSDWRCTVGSLGAAIEAAQRGVSCDRQGAPMDHSGRRYYLGQCFLTLQVMVAPYYRIFFIMMMKSSWEIFIKHAHGTASYCHFHYVLCWFRLIHSNSTPK